MYFAFVYHFFHLLTTSLCNIVSCCFVRQRRNVRRQKTVPVIYRQWVARNLKYDQRRTGYKPVVNPAIKKKIE